MQKRLPFLLLLLLSTALMPAFAQVTTTFSKFAVASGDDAEETSNGTIGTVTLNSSDLELMTDGTVTQQIGVRFTNITIPQGAVIQNAFIQFATKGDKAPVSGTISIKGQAADNAAIFTTGLFNVSLRALTTEAVSWPGSTSVTWGTTAGGTRGPDQKTPDVKTIVQAIVNRAGWTTGNAMAFVFTGSGVRNAYSVDGSATLAPQLIIQYVSGAYPANVFPIAAGSTWKYFDAGTVPAPNWADSSYDDAAWNFSNAKFGYNDNPATTISYGADANNKYITTYFRYIFNMTNTANVDSLIMRMQRDDGAIVYMNGTEVFRSNMPAGAVSNNTVALSDAVLQDENAFFSTVIKNNLVNGRNVIAVELHQSSATTDDAGFDMQVIAKRVPMPVTNFPVNRLSQWYYLDDGTNQGTDFKEPGYHEGTWNYGPGKLGYSDGAVTVLSTGPVTTNKYITYYFRKKFNVNSVATLNDSLELNLLRDDAAVVYINGTEVLRSNMPAGAFDYQTFSTTIVDGADELTYFGFRISKNLLIDGINTIAVEIHQRDGTSSDLGFDLELKEIGAAALVRGPFLQSGTSTSMVIRWRTDAVTNSRVKFGTSENALTNIVDDATPVTEHEVRLTNLSPLTKYYYSIGSAAVTLQGNADNYFSTLPVPGATGLVRIGVIGDCGNNSTNQIQVRNELKNYLGPNYMNAWILLGDNAYSNATDAEYQAEFFNIYKDGILKQNPMYPAPGNHDYNNGSTVAQNDHNVPYFTTFSMPINGEAGGVPSNNKAYYSFDIGNIHFLSLDSYGKEDNATRLYDTLGRQVQWIKADLAANANKGWIVAYWHHPPFTKGSHNSDTEGELVSIRTNFIRILERMGVDLILCGHSHDYERSKLQLGHYGAELTFDAAVHNVSISSGLYNGSANSCPYIKDSVNVLKGTVYAVSGSAGQLGGTTAGFPHNAMYYSDATHGGSMMLEVEGNRLDAKWICADGVIRDQFTMMKEVNHKTDTTIAAGNSITLTASYKGNYTWLPGNQTTRSITVTPAAGLNTYYVRDNFDCIADTFNITAASVVALAWGNITGWYDKSTKVNKLEWQTFTESNTAHFVIERSTDALNFTVSGNLAAAGNNNSLKEYRFTDNNVDKRTAAYYYRLKLINANGTFEYSRIVKISPAADNNLIDVQVVPNPGSSTSMKIRLVNGNIINALLKITDASGRTVYSNKVTLTSSLQSFLTTMAPGVYFLTVSTDAAFITKQLFVK